MDKRKPNPSSNQQDPRKRKEPSSGAGSQQTRPSRFPNKRVKIHDARNIRSQPPDAALDGDGKLDLLKFMSAREYEVKALQSSMQKCKDANASRVFQEVPRSMRRRTASHNPKRVPKRLRERAKHEMFVDNAPLVEARKRRPRTTRARIRLETAKRLEVLAARQRKKRLEKSAAEGGGAGIQPADLNGKARKAKIRRNALNEPPKATSKFRKRQINKTWLPTHMWHAKRARMTEPGKPLWRFAIPLTPTEKCYRPTHRATEQKGAVAWDVSYMSTIGLYGSGQGVERVLRALGLTQESLWGVRGQKWRKGLRKWTGFPSKQRKDGRRCIGPATIIWNPEDPDGEGELDEASRLRRPRQLLIRTHPACFLELFNELVQLVKMQSPQLHVEDLRFEIGSIEIVGPGSTESLISVLKPYSDNDEVEGCQGRIFQSLAGVTNPSSLPKDATLSFSIRDPRLAYPPKKVPVPRGAGQLLQDTLTNWPVEEHLKPSGLFDRDARYRASQLPSQKSINRRRGSGLPGRALGVTDSDPPIPITLLASRPAADGQTQGTWTLLAPWKCILPIWYSLMHYPLSTGGTPRFGGLDEQAQVAFEQGCAWFPGDFPATDAGVAWELHNREKLKSAWDRRPKSKRVEWESLDLGGGRKGEVGDGMACDFEYLFGIPRGSDLSAQTSGSSTDAPDAMEVDHGAGEGGHRLKASVSHPLSALTQITKGSFEDLVSASETGTAPKHSIATVILTFIGRGVAGPCARIYRLPIQSSLPSPSSPPAEVSAADPPPTKPEVLPCDLRDQWLSKLPLQANKGNRGQGQQKGKGLSAPPRMPPGADAATRTRLLAASLLSGGWAPDQRVEAGQMNVGGHPLCPGKQDLMGFVTTGSYCLSEGKATAIGSISVERALEAVKGSRPREGKLCIVRNAGENVGWLARWEVI